MTFDRNFWGGYTFGKFNVYSSYNETDVVGNQVEGFCWCVKEDLYSDTIAFVSEQLEEILEWVLENN